MDLNCLLDALHALLRINNPQALNNLEITDVCLGNVHIYSNVMLTGHHFSLSTRPQEMAWLIRMSASLALMLANDSVDLFDRELIQCDNLGFGAKSWRQNAPCLFLAVNFHDHPGSVFPVHAPPVSVRHVMGACREKDLNNASTCQPFSLMLNFNKKSWHF